MNRPAAVPDTVRVYVVTYRRPAMLERALRSLLSQTHTGWVAQVVNDDPADERVAALVERLGDDRIRLFAPAARRGGTANFNLAFTAVAEPFASILEDDNWWEPVFLERMLEALAARPHIDVAVANERVWREQPDGTWQDSGVTIWPPSTRLEEYACAPLDKCGSAKLCNSSMLFRTPHAAAWRIPDSVPIDVSEHFRERVVPHPVLLVHEPLVNYGETLMTHRSKSRGVWAQYQLLLIGSVFRLERPQARPALARALWREARTKRPLMRNPLLSTALFVPEARSLWDASTRQERLRFLLSSLRHPRSLLRLRRTLDERRAAWVFLQAGWFADFMREPSRDSEGPR